MCLCPDNQDEMCYILEEDSSQAIEKLTVMKEVLIGTEYCKPKLDRSLKVNKPILLTFLPGLTV